MSKNTAIISIVVALVVGFVVGMYYNQYYGAGASTKFLKDKTIDKSLSPY